MDKVNDDSIDLAWIGLYDDLNSWKWTLEDSDFFKVGEKNFRNWYDQGPGNSGGQSLCVYMNNGIWYAASCSNSFYLMVYLVSIRNETEHQKIQDLLKNNYHYYYVWIGLYRTRSWSDQSNSSFSNWRAGQPDNAGNSEYCTAVSFSESGNWTDENCNTALPFICYSGE
uniref:C-type lectin domain-containing protein n=1 Tax=Sinocyclocheilus rhinocerous TaxID=307959 RepID=A0A673I7X0_9TELE